MWKGTMEEYFNFIKWPQTTKRQISHLKIGGHASCGFYYLQKPWWRVQTPPQEPVTSYTFTSFEIQTLKKTNPLISSWHSYANPQENIKYAKYARKMLDEYGLYDTETILNEWN